MENNNRSIGTIQRILGHENQSTTEVYLHSIGDFEKKAIAVLDQTANFSHTDSHKDPNTRFLNPRKSFKKMVRPAGFEPATYGFEVRRSIH